MVSELRTSKIDIETFTSLLGSAALVEDDYRPRVKHVVQSVEPRSPDFELFRQVLERVVSTGRVRGREATGLVTCRGEERGFLSQRGHVTRTWISG